MKPTLSKTGRRVRRVCVILIVTVISYVIASVAGTAVVFRVIFARTTVVNAFELTYEDVDQSRYPRTEVSFASGGNRLFGAVYLPRGEAEGLVLVLNGVNSCIDRHLPEIMYFVDHGFAALTFDNTGVGRSEGDGTVGLAQARLDAAAAINYINGDSTLSQLPLVLYGHSMGGYAAATVLSDAANVRAAVIVSSFDSPNENMRYNARQYAGALADMQYPFMCLQNYFLFGGLSGDTAVDAINESGVPVMIVGSACDEIVPMEISIFGKAELITNQNAVITEIADPYRGRHSGAWLSTEAAKYLAETENPADKQRANEIDEDFMAELTEFYRRSLRR